MDDRTSSKRILLACRDDKDFFLGTIVYHFAKAGWQVDSCVDLTTAKKLLVSAPISLAIVDAPFPEPDKLIEFIKCRRATSLIPVIQLMPTGGEEVWNTAFRFIGNEQLFQPFEVSDMLKLAERELQRARSEQSYFRQEVYFRFPTDDRFLDRANEVAAKLFADTGLSETGQVQLCTAFREAVSNAAQHGNRHQRELVINVQYFIDDQRVTVVVNDMGAGFDWRRYIDDSRGGAVEVRRKRSQHGRLGGLGIMLMKKCVDKLEYNDAGNAITLTKFLAPQNAARMRADVGQAMA